jgi:hypothetical protein
MKKFIALLIVVGLAVVAYLYYPQLLEPLAEDASVDTHFVADKEPAPTAIDKINGALDALDQKFSPAEIALQELKTTLKDEVLEIDLLTNTDAVSDVHTIYQELVDGYHERIATKQGIDTVLPMEG